MELRPRKEYVIIEDHKCGDNFNRVIRATSDIEAITKAYNEWQRLTDYDKSHRSEFAVGKCCCGDDGWIYCDTFEFICSFKER